MSLSIFLPPLVTALVTLCLAWLATGRVTAWLRQRAILDQPNHRSSHTIPTPRGGGMGVLAALLPIWAGLALVHADAPGALAVLPALAGALLLAGLSFVDDLRGLPVALRFGAQIAVIAGLVFWLPVDARLFQGWLPFWADRLLTLLGWVWFVNLFNFMDGIDGIAGVETMAIGLGVSMIAGLAGWTLPGLWGIALAAAALGFLAWNWHPAKVFLGDVGSVPLGVLGGWLLIQLAIAGAWAAALILPGYFLADATLTLLRRAVRGEKIWQAHREHFYQRAVRAGLRHDQVSGRIALVNGGLILCALLATLWSPWAGLAAAILVIAALLIHLARAKATSPL